MGPLPSVHKEVRNAGSQAHMLLGSGSGPERAGTADKPALGLCYARLVTTENLENGPTGCGLYTFQMEEKI